MLRVGGDVHADVLAIEGESYRLREAEKRATRRSEVPKRS
jgi:hypothetical protein